MTQLYLIGPPNLVISVQKHDFNNFLLHLIDLHNFQLVEPVFLRFKKWVGETDAFRYTRSISYTRAFDY